MIRLSELQLKEIIAVDDGKRLGHISDLELDVDNGRILSLVLTGNKAGGFFKKGDEFLINWNQIVTIGADVILVSYSASPRLFLENRTSGY